LTLAILTSIYLIKITVDLLWNKTDRDRSGLQLAALLGAVETVIYIFALQWKYESFIGLWLSIKTAGRWATWTSQKDKIPKNQLSTFLIGNALAVGNAVAYYKAIYYWTQGHYCLSIFLPTFLVIGILAIIFWLLLQNKDSQTKQDPFRSIIKSFLSWLASEI
jgi:hypothetical protein